MRVDLRGAPLRTGGHRGGRDGGPTLGRAPGRPEGLGGRGAHHLCRGLRHLGRRLPEGEESVNGVRVGRFASAAGREPSFHPLVGVAPRRPGPGDVGGAERWVDLQGPVNPGVVEAAADVGGRRVIFYPYLYYPTVRAIDAGRGPDHPPPGRPRRACPAPTGLRRVFGAADGLVFQTDGRAPSWSRACSRSPATTSCSSGWGWTTPTAPPAADRRRRPVPAGRCRTDARTCSAWAGSTATRGPSLLADLFAAYKAAPSRSPPPRVGRAGRRGPRRPSADRRPRTGVGRRQVGAARRGRGPGVAVVVGGILVGGRRGMERPHPRTGQRRLRGHRRALPAIGWRD